MSSQGIITADIIKNAMFASADDIENRYKKMPKTFADYWTLIKNKAIDAFTPVIEKISEMINTPQFEEFFNNFCVAIDYAAEAVNWLIDGLGWLYNTLEPYAPFIWAIVAALAAYKVYTLLAAAAQGILNLAQAASPTGLFIAAIVACIVILAYFGAVNEDVANGIIIAWDGLIIGAMTLWLGIKTAFYAIIIVAQLFYLGILGVVTATLTVFFGLLTGFQTVVTGVLILFQNMYNGVVNYMNAIIDIINKIPGIKFDKVEVATFADEAVDSLMSDIMSRNEMLKNLNAEIDKTNASIASNKANFKADLENSVYDLQAQVIERNKTRDDRVKNRNNWINDIQGKINEAMDIGNNAKDKIKAVPVEAVGGKLDNAGEVNISDEDLEYLKDFAQQEFINKFTTATLAPNVTVQFGDVRETADIDEVRGRIEEILKEEISEVAEGAYT